MVAMAFSVSVHKELNLVFTEYRGHLDTPQLIEALACTLEHPDYRAGMVELTDLSGVTGMDLDYERVRTHVSRMANHYGHQQEQTEHYAIASADLAYGMTRIYQALSETNVPNMTLHVYRSEGDALRAMGRDEDSIAELPRG